MTDGEETRVSSKGDFLGRKRYENYLLTAPGGVILSPGTQDAYGKIIGRLERCRKDLTLEYIISFMTKDQRKPVRSALAYYLRALGMEDLVTKLPRVKARDPILREIPTYEEFISVIKKLDEEDDMIAKFLLNTGMRCHEAFMIKLGDITPEGIIIIETKGGGQREVRLYEEFRKELVEYLTGVKSLANGELIFFTENKASLQSKVKKFWSRLNRESVRTIGKHIGTHDFRRFYGTYLYKRTKDLQLVQRLMGHKRIETTLRYTRYATKEEDLEKGRKLIGELLKQQ